MRDETQETEQADILAWLSEPGLHDYASGGIQRITTHAAYVILAGAYAYKMKRAVQYPYLDFSTLEKRKIALERELKLNRRTAPWLYLDVIPVMRQRSGSFAFGGEGSVAEWLLRMQRFDVDAALDHVAARGALQLSTMDTLAREVAQFHAGSDRRPDKGGAPAMAALLAMNRDELSAAAVPPLIPDRIAVLYATGAAILSQQSVLLDRRRQAGFVRQCHGDLHLGNIVLLDGQPKLFDCIEFNDDIACIDVLYDLAFLLMDLLHNGLRAHANRALNAYLWEIPIAELGNTLDGLALLPLFLSCRAAIRSHVTARSSGDRANKATQAAITAYFELAEQVLQPFRPSVVAIGGLSGSGKTTLARSLAPKSKGPAGAVILRTDVLRKQTAAVAQECALPAAHYTPEASQRVYDEMLLLAKRTVQAGQCVILDGVFAREAERRAVEQLATDLGVPFAGLWLHAPVSEMTARLGARRNDASDATKDVLERQTRYDLGRLDWMTIEAGGLADAVCKKAQQALNLP